MHKLESILENKTHKLLWDFKIQTSHSISARRSHLEIVNKKKENLRNSRLCCSDRPQDKNEKKDKYEVHTISFQTFFVRTFKIVVDS